MNELKPEYEIIETTDVGYTVNFTVPIRNTKKWWQFWKQSKSKEDIQALMARYKDDICFDENTGQLEIKNENI